MANRSLGKSNNCLNIETIRSPQWD